MSVVNVIEAKSLHHRQFQALLKDVESNYSNVLHYNSIRWLNVGKVLERVWALKHDIHFFHDIKGIKSDVSTNMNTEEFKFE